MMTRGRPLGFIGMIVLGWGGVRGVMLWPSNAPVLSSMARAAEVDGRIPSSRHMVVATNAVPLAAAAVRFAGGSPPPQWRAAGVRQLTDAQILALYGAHYYVETRAGTAATEQDFAASARSTLPPADAIAAALASATRGPSRWRMSGWLIARPGDSDPRLEPSLGASQTGARLSYAIDAARRMAVFARVSTPLSRPAAEVAVGAQWQPTRAPVTGYVEARRRAGGGVVPSAGVFGGVSSRLPADFRLDAYGQAGWVGGRDATGFGDGQVRALHDVAHAERLRLDVGFGAWGAAQRGAARLDVGPTAGVTLPLGAGSARLSLDWRQRVAGHAAPGSGPALSLGAGF